MRTAGRLLDGQRREGIVEGGGIFQVLDGGAEVGGGEFGRPFPGRS